MRRIQVQTAHKITLFARKTYIQEIDKILQYHTISLARGPNIYICNTEN